MTVCYLCFWTEQLPFNAVFLEIRVSRVEQWVGITGSALQWFRTHLSDRTFTYTSGGITQGSILGTVLFYLYLLLLGIILQKNNICFHYYADDCQIYFPLMQIAASSLISALITSELPTQHTVKLVMVEDVEGPDFLLHVLSVTLLSSVKTTGTPLDNLLVLVFTSKCQSSCTALHRTH